MSEFNLRKNPLKIIIVGPQKVGKTVIANTISEFSKTVSPDYHPTVGVRILEISKPYTDEQVANIPVLKKNKINKVRIELWDMSGDRRFESTWPAIKYGADGVIIVLDAVNEKYEATIDEWMNNFCTDINPDNIICFSYKKENSKGLEKKKQSHQFPNMNIAEVTNSMDSLLPHFNKFITKLLLKL
jgi:GTPase SAR1 family protein